MQNLFKQEEAFKHKKPMLTEHSIRSYVALRQSGLPFSLARTDEIQTVFLKNAPKRDGNTNGTAAGIPPNKKALLPRRL